MNTDTGVKPRITSVTQLWNEAENYTWELYQAWYDCKAQDFLKRSGAQLVNGNHVRYVTKKQTNSLKLGNSWLNKPKASEITFHCYTPGGSIPSEDSLFRNDVIVVIQAEDFPEPFRFHLRPIQ